MLGYKEFTSWDGTKIVYQSWNLTPEAKGIILILHRGHEHSQRMTEMANFFVKKNYTVYAWDARGNGYSEGPRDDAETFSVFARDLQLFVELILDETQREMHDIMLVASSMGAVVASSWVHDYAPNIRGMVLATPAYNIRLYVPFAIPLLKIARKFALLPTVSSYVKSKMLTHDRAQQKEYNQDPLISSSISTDLLIDTYQTGQRLIDDAGAITTPTLVICAGKDWVVSRKAQWRFYDALSSSKKEWCYYPDSYHAVFHEDNKLEVFERCQTFIDNCFSNPVESIRYETAHQVSPSKHKMDALTLPSANPLYPVTKLLLNTIGRLSKGIEIGVTEGFDSGKSLDNIYRNQAEGRSVLGRFFDRIYLNSPGWVGIRYRKKMINDLLTKYVGKKASCRIFDIASGNGRYLFDLLKEASLVTVEMRDYDTSNVHKMNEKIQNLALLDRAVAKQADAFSKDSYGHEDTYDLAIASGIFELFSDNNLITTALTGIAQQVEESGYFLYTNQPWHPQQKFIAKTLTNHKGQPWVMRCRSQAEMDSLVTAAGFKKVEMLIDPTGIFTVSVAKKLPR